MKSVYQLFMLTTVAAYGSYGSGYSYDSQSNAQSSDTQRQGGSVFCLPCVFVSKVLSMYVRPVSSAMDFVCMAMDLGLPCSGTAKMFLGALEVGGPRHACTLVHLCGADGLQVPSALKPLASDVEKVAGGIKNFTTESAGYLSQSIKQTASGLGHLISGSSNVAGKFAGLVPVFGNTLESMIGGTGKYFGDLSERLGSGIGNIFDTGAASQTGYGRRKRSANLPTQQEAKNFLDQFDFNLSPEASEIAKAFQLLAREIKEKTIAAVKAKEEKLKKDSPIATSQRK